MYVSDGLERLLSIYRLRGAGATAATNESQMKATCCPAGNAAELNQRAAQFPPRRQLARCPHRRESTYIINQLLQIVAPPPDTTVNPASDNRTKNTSIYLCCPALGIYPQLLLPLLLLRHSPSPTAYSSADRSVLPLTVCCAWQPDAANRQWTAAVVACLGDSCRANCAVLGRRADECMSY